MGRYKSKVEESHQDIGKRLGTVRRRELFAKLLRGVCISAFIYASLLVAALVMEETFRFGVPARSILFWTVHGGGVVAAAWNIFPPLLVLLRVLQGETDFDTARWLGAKFPVLRDHLLNALQLVSNEDSSSNYSSDFVTAAFDEAKNEFDQIDLKTSTDFSPVKKSGGLAAGSVVTLLLLFGLFPASFFGSFERFWNHGLTYAIPVPFQLIVDPGNKEITKGEAVRITVRVDGEAEEPIRLFTKPAGEVVFDEISLDPHQDGSHSHEVASLNTSTAYYAASGDVRTEEYLLTVVDRPVLRMLRLTVNPPGYSRLATLALDDNVGDVAGLKGTLVDVVVEASKELARATIVFDNGTEKEMEVTGSEARGNLRLMRDATYHIALVDPGGLENKDPVEYTLTVVPDAYPRAFIEAPGVNLDVAGNENLDMLFRISDDYGFARLRLAYRLVGSRYEQPADEDSYVDIELPRGIGSEGIVPYAWPLGGLSLVPEDAIAYHIELYDNDNVSGPKLARSESFLIRLPSLEEVFADVDDKHELSLETLREALADTREARKEVEELQQEIRKKQQEADWQEQRKAEDLFERYKNIQKQLDEASQTIDQMVKEMEKNTLLSEETLEKYMELQQMMEELNSPEFAEAMKRLQEAMQRMSPEEMMKAMENFNFTEEQFRKSIERTMNLLKRIQIEQKVDEAIRRLEEAREEQEAIQQQTESIRPDQEEKASDAAERQRELGSQMEEMRKALDDLREMMMDFPSEMPLEELQQAMAQLDSAALDALMQQISEQMDKMQMGEAQSGQQQAMQSLDQLLQQMNMMRDAMLQNQQQQIVNELRKIYQDLLDLSRRQEEMKNQTAGLERNSQQFREGASDQMEAITDLSRIAERLSAVGQKSFGVTPEMGRAVGDAIKQMGEAMNSLGQRSGASAAELQKGAMASLNEAAQQVQAGMNAMMQGSGQGMGMSGLLQRMQNMTSMQQGINQGTQHLGGMGQQRAAEMGRLAGEQGMVRKSLEQLAREASHSGNLSRLLGDLNDIAREMREVQTDLAQGSIHPETLRKQDRILSRLLDSQRSMNERDFEKKRRAETGKKYPRGYVPPVDLTTDQGREQLRRDLLRAMEEGYSRDYQNLIKSYFELLQSAEKPENP